MPAEKGSYRSVYSAIWDDPEFQAFDADAMAVFFCLRTSRDCNFPCIFAHYHTTLYERMPHIDHARIDTGIDTLIKSGWVRYDRPVLWIVKGLKNEPNYYPNNPKHISGIVKILKSLPKLKIVEEFATYYKIPFKFDTPINTGIDTQPIPDPIQGTGTGTGKGKESKDLRRPVDNSNAPPLVDGAVVGGNGLKAIPPPAPPTGKAATPKPILVGVSILGVQIAQPVDLPPPERKPTPEEIMAQATLIEQRRLRGIPESGRAGS